MKPSESVVVAPVDRSAYCERCDALVVVAKVESKKTNTGKAYLEGRCPQCSSAVRLIPVSA